MRIRTALALGVLALPLLAHAAAAAAPTDREARLLDGNVSLFTAIAREGAARTASAAQPVSGRDGSDQASSIGTHDKRDRYAIGAVFGLGVAAYFLRGSHQSDHLLIDPPAGGPGGSTPPQNDGSVNNGANPDLPPQVGPDTTVTPEPGTLMLLGTGLTSLTVVARRRRILR